jgi:predicted Holliday junction resolvase-like endonuclease
MDIVVVVVLIFLVPICIMTYAIGELQRRLNAQSELLSDMEDRLDITQKIVKYLTNGNTN